MLLSMLRIDEKPHKVKNLADELVFSRLYQTSREIPKILETDSIKKLLPGYLVRH